MSWKYSSTWPFKIEVCYDKENNVPMSAEFEWKMLYILLNSKLKQIECFSTYRVTKLNTPEVGYIPGENPIQKD